MSDTELSERIFHALQDRGLTVAMAESLTGGLVSSALIDVPGSSAVVRGGVIAYATDLKATLLSVDAALLAERGAVDADVAVAMADGVRALTGADIGLATTGVAGPDGQDGIAPGVVFVAVTGAVSGLEEHMFAGSRNAVRAASVVAVLRLLDRLLAG